MKTMTVLRVAPVAFAALLQGCFGGGEPGDGEYSQDLSNPGTHEICSYEDNLDNDGDVDVLVTNNNGPARLLINHIGQRNQWVGLRLVGGAGPRDMLGARVGVFRDIGRPLWRHAHTDGSYASANDPRVLVGLGDAATVRRVQVIWPSGQVEDFVDVFVDRWQTLTEGTGQSADP